jgi:hypothetical protein
VVAANRLGFVEQDRRRIGRVREFGDELESASEANGHVMDFVVRHG